MQVGRQAGRQEKKSRAIAKHEPPAAQNGGGKGSEL